MGSSLDRALEAIETEVAAVRRRLEWLEGLAAQLRGDDERRAGRLVASAHDQTQTSRIVEYVATHPGATAAPIARDLGFDRNVVATRLTQLTTEDNPRLTKLKRGYALSGSAAAQQHAAPP